MWRGYGAHGSGAAIVLNTDFLTARAESPLIIAKVEYVSDDDRRAWLRHLVEIAKKTLLDNNIENDKLHIFSFYVFELMKLHSLLTKHHGFAEEREWRIIYFPERDQTGILSDGFTYVVGPNGVEPRLRFPIKPLPFESPEAWTFNGIVETIILGPSLSSAASANSVRKMFQALGKHELAAKITASGIPLRPATNRP
jgi:hypothetical protein